MDGFVRVKFKGSRKSPQSTRNFLADDEIVFATNALSPRSEEEQRQRMINGAVTIEAEINLKLPEERFLEFLEKAEQIGARLRLRGVPRNQDQREAFRKLLRTSSRSLAPA